MTDKKKDLQVAVETVFEEREKFIVFGLTGRTGSGCSTAADLLSKSFEDFGPPSPRSGGDLTLEDRQYRIAHAYLRTSWGRFQVIRAADVISSFVLERDVDKFLREYASVLKLRVSDVSERMKCLRELFTTLHEKRIDIRARVSRDERSLADDDIYTFNFYDLPRFTREIKVVLENVLAGSYTKFYQHVANNIRRSGTAYSSVFAPKYMFKLAQRVNSFIKQLRLRQKQSGGRVLVCIDAIRNPFEASFFRERYSAFYLVSISTDEPERRRRLRGGPFGYGEATIDQIDMKECPKKLTDEEFYYSQNLQKCVEMADIHVHNPFDVDKAFRHMKTLLAKYVALVMHPGLVQPTDLERCMQIAVNAKVNSGCVSRQVGAVITDPSYSVKAIGWNDPPEGLIPCSLRSVSDLLAAEDRDAFSDYERTDEKFRERVISFYRSKIESVKVIGWPLSFCFKDVQNCVDEEKNQVHTRALHAEENAFLQITKYGGQAIKGGFLFTTSSPCELCAKKAYQLGITKIYYLDLYPGISSSHVLGVGALRPEVLPFVGAVGRGYQQLFDPVMPHKESMKNLMLLDIPNVKSELRSRIRELEYKCESLSRENQSLKGHK